MRIQHNIMAMGAYRNYTNNLSAMKKNLEKLSSGYKINRAGDDAAGLAISEKMRAQITGLETAQKNAKDGISLVQTAEGALTEVHDMLNRMVTLATQSANGTYDNETDRAQLQKELDQLRTEIDRIADSSNFNGIKLLDGSLDSKHVMEVGATTGGMNKIELPPVGTQELGVDTVLHKGSTEAGKTSFSINFGNQTFENKEGDKLEVTIGEGDNAVSMVLEGTADGEGMQAEDIAKALADKYGENGTETLKLKDADGNEQEFTVKLGANGYSLDFEQVDTPMTEGQVVEAPNSVKITGTTGNTPTPPAPDAKPGTAGKYSVTISNAFKAGDKVTIGGKEITFGTVDDAANNAISVNTNDTKEKQAAAIAKLFEGDETWKVTNPDNAGTATAKLTFEQVTPDTNNVLADPIVSSTATVGGAMGEIKATIEYKPATAEIDFTGNNLNVADQMNIGGKTIKFVSTLNSGATDEVLVGADEATSVKNLAEYINKNSDTLGFTAEVNKADSNKLLLTPNKGANVDTSDISITKKPVSNVPTVTADPNNTGKWTLTLEEDSANAGDHLLKEDDELTILGHTITVGATTATTGVKEGDTIANALQAIVDEMNTASNAADAGSNLAGLKFSLNATNDAIVIEKRDPNSELGTISQSDITLKGNPTPTSAPGITPGTATAAKWEINLDKPFANGDVLTIKFGNTEKTFKFSTTAATAGDTGNGYTINVAAGTGADSIEDQIDAILDATNGLNGQFDTDFTVVKTSETVVTGTDDSGNPITETKYKLEFTQATAKDPDADGVDGSKLTFTVAQETAGAFDATGTGATAITPIVTQDTEAVDPEVPEPAETPNTPTMTPSSDYLVDVNTIKQGAPANSTRLASTVFELTDDIIKDGNMLRIGDKTYTIKRGAESTTEAAEGTELLDLSKFDDADVLHEAAIMLSNKDNGVFEATGYDGNKVSFLEKKTQLDGGAGVALDTYEKVQEQFQYGTAEVKADDTLGKSLALQIGDTAEDFNQLKVDIKDMHAAAMGASEDDATTINDISIADQDSAAKAVDVIKRAINYVSDVRGTLGATQNRLDHTINNLSVMTENIQDAESTIRDTDVAEEMMAYTKNNILIQSAQAMLAQANQVPQGVLQLLQ